jgi:hypothetical protein
LGSSDAFIAPIASAFYPTRNLFTPASPVEHICFVKTDMRAGIKRTWASKLEMRAQ